MYKVVEYICYNKVCAEENRSVERFLDTNKENEDNQICFVCGRPVTKVLSSVKGYVKGTQNPVKC